MGYKFKYQLKMKKMKKKILLVVFVLAAVTSFAQSDKYIAAMEKLVPQIDTTQSITGLNELANSFQRIADAEKTQWLPYYYSALATISTANMISKGQMGMADKTDPICDKAEAQLNKAEALAKDNSEIFCIKKMIASMRLIGDPMNRYQTELPKAAEYLETAKSLNADNPRVYLLEAQDKYYTPAEYGGSKEEGKKIFELAVKKFEKFKPETTIHPSWGLGTVKYMLAQAD
jgi:hypothetical protein